MFDYAVRMIPSSGVLWNVGNLSETVLNSNLVKSRSPITYVLITQSL